MKANRFKPGGNHELTDSPPASSLELSRNIEAADSRNAVRIIGPRKGPFGVKIGAVSCSF